MPVTQGHAACVFRRVGGHHENGQFGLSVPNGVHGGMARAVTPLCREHDDVGSTAHPCIVVRLAVVGNGGERWKRLEGLFFLGGATRQWKKEDDQHEEEFDSVHENIAGAVWFL